MTKYMTDKELIDECYGTSTIPDRLEYRDLVDACRKARDYGRRKQAKRCTEDCCDDHYDYGYADGVYEFKDKLLRIVKSDENSIECLGSINGNHYTGREELFKLAIAEAEKDGTSKKD